MVSSLLSPSGNSLVCFIIVYNIDCGARLEKKKDDTKVTNDAIFSLDEYKLHTLISNDINFEKFNVMSD